MTSPRDVEIVRLIGQFKMMSSGHINELLFYDNTSSTPSNRVLARLTRDRYLGRIERRLIGGTGGGSGHYCYQLGSKGHAFLRRQTRYWPIRTISFHTLAIADVFVDLVRAERSGQLKVLHVVTEPESWLEVAGAELRPDLRVDMAVPSRRVNLSMFLEIDLGSERHKQLTDKMRLYVHANDNWLSHHGLYEDNGEIPEALVPTFPKVMFLVPDVERLNDVRGLIARGAEEAQQLFDVKLLADFPTSALSV